MRITVDDQTTILRGALLCAFDEEGKFIKRVQEFDTETHLCLCGPSNKPAVAAGYIIMCAHENQLAWLREYLPEGMLPHVCPDVAPLHAVDQEGKPPFAQANSAVPAAGAFVQDMLAHRKRLKDNAGAVDGIPLFPEVGVRAS